MINVRIFMEKLLIFTFLIFSFSCARTSQNCHELRKVDNLLVRSQALIDQLKLSRNHSQTLKNLEENPEFVNLEKDLHELLEKILENHQRIKSTIHSRGQHFLSALSECDSLIKSQEVAYQASMTRPF